MSNKHCGDCGVSEGQLHEYGCDMERCPFCGRQLISCNCCYKQLHLIDRIRYSSATCYLPPHIFMNGLGEALEAQWITILETKGRIPWINYPIICARCGALWPDLFMVPNEEWRRYIQPDMRDSVICHPCYDEIKHLIDLHPEERTNHER